MTNETTPRLPVFVYGTLRTGQYNWDALLRGRTIRETPAVAPDHALYGRGIPYATPRAGFNVIGDLMEIAPARYERVLADLDQLESYNPRTDRGLYLRRAVTVYTRDEQRPVQAWMYHAGPRALRHVRDDDLVPDGDYVAALAQASVLW